MSQVVKLGSFVFIYFTLSACISALNLVFLLFLRFFKFICPKGGWSAFLSRLSIKLASFHFFLLPLRRKTEKV